MKKVKVFLCSVLLLVSNILLAQPHPKAIHLTYANRYNAAYGVVGNIDYNAPASLSKSRTVFASGLWLGGIERDNDQLKAAITTYYSGGYDFVAGPLDLNKKTEEEKILLAKQYDKIWVVTATEIRQHQEDFKDGKIDNPQPSIMAWPAKGNPNFETFNFFKNDYDTQDLAPFKDVNNDGIYTPLQGDYPFITQAHANHQPDEIFWSIFNDNAPHTNSKGKPMMIEIQQTGWTFSCSSDPILNSTNFLSFKVLNKGKSALDSLFMGYWIDFDLGCPNDDLLGSSPTSNAFFVYNKGDFDGVSGACSGDFVPFKEKGVPTSSVSFLNQPLYSFMSYNNSSVGTPASWAIEPSNTFDFFRYMNAQWKDGTPVTRGGFGYNKNSTDYTKFMFDGNPNDSTAWSMKTLSLPNMDKRGIGNCYLKSLAPNQSVTLDIALTLHYDATQTTTAGQIDNMYMNLPKLQNAYNQQFVNKCAAAKCQSDCVFPGDANNDGRADERDFLTIIQHLNKKGKARNSTTFWEGNTNEDWAEKTNLGVNLKHTDCDGNGTIEEEGEKVVLFENCLKTHAKFQIKPDVVLSNNEIALAVNAGDSLNINTLGGNFLMNIRPNLADNDAIAYSFELDFDTRFFKSLTTNTKRNFLKVINKNQTGNIHFATSFIGRQSFIFSVSDEVKSKKKVPSECTEMRFKNIQAIRADGSIIPNIGARDVRLCFNQSFVKTIENEQLIEDVLIYPNPFNDYVIIENKNTQLIDYQLFDIQGKSLKIGKINAENQAELMLDLLPKGVYLLKMSSSKGAIRMEKIIKIE